MLSKLESQIVRARALLLIVVAIMVHVWFAQIARAQTPAAVPQHTLEIGANFDPSASGAQRIQGAFSLLETLDSGATFSKTTFLVNRPVKGQFTYAMLTGLECKFKCYTRTCFYLDAEGGVATSSTATSGAGQFGGTAVYTRNAHLGFYSSVHGSIAPASAAGGSFNLTVQAGIRINP